MEDSVCSNLSGACLEMLTHSMRLDLKHMDAELSSFTLEEQETAIHYIEKLYAVSQRVKQGIDTVADYNNYYCQSDSKLNFFQQGMFDAIALTLQYCGSELWKELHTHTNRGGESWFPIVIFPEALEDYCSDFKLLTIYRGCNKSEHQANFFGQCWTTCNKVAIEFAFNKYQGIDTSQRRVYQADVSCEDVIWIPEISSEKEVVIKRDAKLKNVREIDCKLPDSHH